MKNIYNINKIRVKQNRKERNRLEDKSGKTKITEREYDEAIQKSIDKKVEMIHNLDDEILESMKIYKIKNRQKQYNDIRLVFYYEGDNVCFHTIKREVGFV